MFEKIKKIIPAEEAVKMIKLSPEMKKLKLERDETVKQIISGKDKRLMFIVGPCSADNEDSVLDYVSRLAVLAEKVNEKIFIVPRLYTNKPRTRGEGYKGMLHSPDPHNDKTDIQAGILALRRLHARAIAESGLSAADEMLYPDNVDYIQDLQSYIAVGARSSENQQHRLVASGFDVAVGIKNPMNGSLSVLLNSIYAAQISNEFKYGGYQVRTGGNEYAHAILRGSVDIYGNNIPNYHYEDVMRFIDMYRAQELKNPAIIIDTNHSNSNKNPFEQVRIVKEVVGNCRHCEKPPNGSIYGKSITDACLGWEKTETLILSVAERL